MEVEPLETCLEPKLLLNAANLRILILEAETFGEDILV